MWTEVLVCVLTRWAPGLAALTCLKTPQTARHDVECTWVHPLRRATDRRAEVYFPAAPASRHTGQGVWSGMKDKGCKVGSTLGGLPSIERVYRPPAGPAALAQAMRSLAQLAADDPRLSPLEVLVRTTVEQVPGATSASVTVRRTDSFRTAASTSDTATRTDRLQYDLGSGPALEVSLEGHLHISNDVTLDRRWPAWGVRAHEETGVTSALAFRLILLGDSEAIAALNVYSEIRDAFDETSVSIGLVLATHGSLFVTAMLARHRAANLMRALESNREIGVAIGILMQRHHLTREQAFDVLRIASQDANRKLADIAAEVAVTGILAIRRWPRSTTATALRP